MPVNIQSRMWHVAGTMHQPPGTVCHLLEQLDCLSAHSRCLSLSLLFAPSFLVSRFDIFTNLICSVITETWVGQRTTKKGGWDMGGKGRGRVMSIRLIQGEQMRADAVSAYLCVRAGRTANDHST